MWRTLTIRVSLTLLIIPLHGCALIQSDTDSAKQVEDAPQLSMQDLHALESTFFTPVTTLDPHRIQPGQIVRVVTGQNQIDADSILVIESAMMAGRVKEVLGERIVLSDVIVINQHRTEQAVPIVSKVPYVSRLFKNTGVAYSGTSIPGEVTISKSEILNAQELTETEFQNFPRADGYGRIGIDFDFNVPTATSFEGSELSVSR